LLCGVLAAVKSVVDRLNDKSSAIVDYVARFPAQLDAASGDDGRPLGAALADIAWARRATARPKFYPSLLAWYADPAPFYRPRDMARRGLAGAVGSVRPVAAADVAAPVGAWFGWERPAPVRCVVEHLSNAVASYAGRDKAQYAEVARAVYAELSRAVDDAESPPPHDVVEVRHTQTLIIVIIIFF